MLSLPTRQEAGFIGGWRKGDANPERKYSAYQRYHAGGISRWTGDRVVTGQGKKMLSLPKIPCRRGFKMERG
jgi:hypothetical protein